MEQLNPVDPLSFMQTIGRIIEFNETKEIESRPRDMLSASLIRQCWWVVRKVLSGQNYDERKDSIFCLIGDKEMISLSSHIVSECVRQHGRISKEKEVPEDKRWIPPAELETATGRWVATVSEAFRTKSFLTISEKYHAFLMMLNLGHDALPELVAAYLASNEDLDAFVQIFKGYGQDSTKGAFIHIDEKWLSSIGDIKQLRSRAQERLESGIENATLRAIYQSIVTGKEYYTIDGSEREPW